MSVIKSGSLPVKPTLVDEYVSGPTLGEIASRVFDHFEEEITQAR